jgi:hypothetical protein
VDFLLRPQISYIEELTILAALVRPPGSLTNPGNWYIFKDVLTIA